MDHDLALPANTDIADDLQEASRAFFSDLTAIEPVAGHPDVARIVTPAGLGRVRRWPETATLPDIAFSHEVIDQALAAGLTVAPQLVTAPDGNGDTALRRGGRWFDAQKWLPGDPPPRAEAAWPDLDDRIDIPVALPPAVFAAVVGAAARLHEATTALAGRGDLPTAPLDLLPGAVRQAHSRHLGALRARGRREPTAQRWLAASERLMAAAEPIVLAASEESRLPMSVLHLGLWPAHTLIQDGALSGLLGWERVAAGSPVLDLAQATLRLQGWNDDTVEAAIGAYGAVRPLTPEERRLLAAVAALDAVATTGRLLEQTYAVPETARPPSALRAGIDMMLRSLTAIERSLTVQASVGKSRRTPWRRDARPPQRQGGKPRERRR
jgi:Ser/Thr protein kinase RdoA (MazF antagonist)